jgi:hypothetical protein
MMRPKNQFRTSVSALVDEFSAKRLGRVARHIDQLTELPSRKNRWVELGLGLFLEACQSSALLSARPCVALQLFLSYSSSRPANLKTIAEVVIRDRTPPEIILAEESQLPDWSAPVFRAVTVDSDCHVEEFVIEAFQQVWYDSTDNGFDNRLWIVGRPK